MKIYGRAGCSTILIAVPIETKISRGTEIRNRRYVRICFVLQETSFFNCTKDFLKILSKKLELTKGKNDVK